MNFQTYTSGGRTYTAAEQAAAWDAYIEQDSYLSEHRGEYAERDGVFLPMVFRADLSIAQDLFTDIGGKRHALQFRVDILNFSNLLNKNWGVGQRLVNEPAAAPTPRRRRPGPGPYRLRVVNNQLMIDVLRVDGRPQRRLPGAVQPEVQLQLGRSVLPPFLTPGASTRPPGLLCRPPLRGRQYSGDLDASA